jgi:CubicO group peptidase (beta-lactamase class C family)
MVNQRSPSRQPLHSLQQHFDGRVALNRGYGGAAVQFSQSSMPLFSAVAGRLGNSGTALMAMDSAFEIASISKLFTAVLVLQLQEAGALQLEAPAAHYLPKDFMKGFLVRDGTDHSGDITVAQLLGHRSGLANFWEDPPLNRAGNNVFIEAFLAESQRLWRPTEVLAMLPGLQPDGLPGQRWHYADSNYVLLGCIVEHLTQQPLHTVLRTKLLGPLAMHQTYLRYHEPPPLQPRPLAHRFRAPQISTTSVGSRPTGPVAGWSAPSTTCASFWARSQPASCLLTRRPCSAC